MKKDTMRTTVDAAAGGALLVGLPLIGILLAGLPLDAYTEFPPLTRHVAHAGFSWPVFGALAAFIALFIAPFVRRLAVAWRGTPAAPSPARTFPWWGWCSLAFGVAAWALAWTRFPWFAACQPFTFSPLWLAYIVTVNALTWRQTGRCLLTHAPGRLAGLFAASAVFWWYFEYLNRFVQNWYYEGVTGISAAQYFWFATLPFATVLPAVLGTCEFLAAFPRTAAGLDRAWTVRVPRPRVMAGLVLCAAGAGLAAVGVWPDWLFPLLWVSPLLVIASLQGLRGRPTVFGGLAHGDWSRLFRLALAALICGFFWEMWNWGSLARWRYCVPFVNRFHLFEMPLLGFAGYLPFGIECAAIADAIAGRTKP